MEQFILQESEKESIKVLLEELKDNERVIGVYMGSYQYAPKHRDDICELVVVIRSREYYSVNKEGEPQIVTIDSRYRDELDKAIIEFHNHVDWKRINIKEDNIGEYSIGLLHVREVRRAKDLLSSTILLDRKGILLSLCKSFNRLEEQWNNSQDISGIDELSVTRQELNQRLTNTIKQYKKTREN